MTSSSEIPLLLRAAAEQLQSADTVDKPVEFRLASMLVKVKNLANAEELGIKNKSAYEIVQEIASQFDKIKDVSQKTEFTPLITALRSWSELENADTNTRAIVKVAVKELKIVPTRIPNIFIWIHEQFKTFAMAFNGLPDREIA
jgi:hypothetical protein